MTIIEKYNSQKANSLTKNERIIFKILDDLSDRRGISDAWDEIDDSIQNEILEQWLKILDDSE